MAAYVKYNCFVYDLGRGLHDLDAGNDEVRVALTNAAPDAANHLVFSDITEITAANGYNNADITNNWTQAANITTLSGVDVQWTATAGNFGPFQYVVMFNANSGSNLADSKLIAYWDYGSSISCNNGESFTWDVPANGTVANIT